MVISRDIENNWNAMPLERPLSIMTRNSPGIAWRALFALVVIICIYMARRPVCTQCLAEDIWLEGPNGMLVYARLYVPSEVTTPLPAVVVCHGYLANLGFMESPWAQDLAILGVASLFMDVHGHGRSDGDWWHRTKASSPLEDWSDVAAAISYLRSRSDLISPERIALLGHSDGGTAALMAGSADWELAATISLSASVAPWEFINHVAPTNLLLIYGAEDHFVIDNTDRLLIRSATRVYLDGDGMVGDWSNGSARQLTTVPGRGHVDLLYSETARREVLRWLGHVFNTDGDISLSEGRVQWVMGGSVCLAMLILFWNGAPSLPRPSFETLLRTAVVLALWLSGLAVAAVAIPSLARVAPAREANVVFATLAAEILTLAFVAATMLQRRRESADERSQIELFKACMHGLIIGIAFQIVLEVLLRGTYETPVNMRTVVLFFAFFILAVPSFGMMSVACSWVTPRHDPGLTALILCLLVALSTAAIAQSWFPRMAALPIYLLACAIALMGAYRAAGHNGSAAGAAVFAAVAYCRTVALVCPLY